MNDSPFHKGADDGAVLLEEIVALIRRFIVVSDSGAIVAAVWVLHAYAFQASDHTPYLFLRSATRRCGKSRFLDLLRLLVPRPLLTANITVPALFRTIDTRQPTVLFDEMDGLASGSRETSDEMRKILNAGFQRGRSVVRCVGDGSNQTPTEFDVFCPKAIAGIRRLPDTIVDRAFTIELKRKAQAEQVERFRELEVEPLAAALRERAAQWAETNVGDLRVARPQLPDELDDRGQDVAEPLLAIADCVGGDWPRKVREAVVELRGSSEDGDGDPGIRLLAGIEAAFDAANADWLSTTDLVHWLTKDEASPWNEWRNLRPITPTAVAKQLSYFNIRPEQHQRGGDRARGYRREQFADAFARYLGPKAEPPATKELRPSRPDMKPEEPNEAVPSPQALENDIARVLDPASPFARTKATTFRGVEAFGDVDVKSAREGTQSMGDSAS